MSPLQTSLGRKRAKNTTMNVEPANTRFKWKINRTGPVIVDFIRLKDFHAVI